MSEQTINEELLTRVLSDFARTLSGRFEISEVLFRLVEHVVEILSVDGAGVSVSDEEGKFRRVTALNQLTEQLEEVEEAHQQGPCVDALQIGKEVIVADLRDQEARWPTWCAAAHELGVRAVLGVPLCVNDQSLGAMNLYSASPRNWTQSEVRVARVLADMAASYLANASDLGQAQRTTEQLREALQSRIIIEQAKGVLAAEMKTTVDDAFTILRNHSRRHGATLRSVAEAVVTLGLRPQRPTRRPKE